MAHRASRLPLGNFGGLPLRRMTPGDAVVAIGLFAAAQALYWLLGVRFDMSPFPGYLQFIDEQLIEGRLLESLWYYHANPPLLNLFMGIGKKVFGEHAAGFYALSFFALGLVAALCVYLLTLRLTASRIVAGVATGLLVFSPAFVLYQNWLLYSFPAAMLLTIAALALHQFLSSQRTRWGVIFFTLLAVLLLTRSLFHIVWMVLVVVLLAVLMRQRWRQVVLAALVPLVVVAAWYGKNYYYFGSFSASTTMGLGLSNITTLMVPRAELEPLVQSGQLSRYALISRYQQKELMFRLEPAQPTGIPVLDNVKKSDGDYNYNNLGMVHVNRCYAADGLEVLRRFPAHYVLGLIIANRMFFSPTSMNMYFTPANRAAAQPMERIFDPLLYGIDAQVRYVEQPHFGFTGRQATEVHTSVPLILLWGVVLGYGYVQARRGVMAADWSIKPRAITIGFIVLTALYVYVLATALELGENNRYRFLIEPLLLVLTLTAATDLVRSVRARLRKLSADTKTPEKYPARG